MGFLSTHILDTANGKPASHVVIRLYSLDNGQRTLFKSTHSNADGRTDEPILTEAEFRLGTWELVFNVAAYFSDHSPALSSPQNDDQAPPFLDEITLRFTLGRDDHYHIPLLVSPWGYSTYRGS